MITLYDGHHYNIMEFASEGILMKNTFLQISIFFKNTYRSFIFYMDKTLNSSKPKFHGSKVGYLRCNFSGNTFSPAGVSIVV